jgi:serine/threonine protein kinase
VYPLQLLVGPRISIGTILNGPSSESLCVEEFINHGGFGEVWAVGQTSRANFAIKTLLTGRLSTDGPFKALMNEMRMAQQIKHPNVVDLLFVNDDPASDYGPYLVSEFIPGGTLEDEIQRCKESKTDIVLEVAVRMMLQIAEGLRAINERIIHRDVKRDNILMDGLTLKIGDFGMAKLVAESTRLATFKGCGHLFYMAPEGWLSETNTPKLDIYAAGLVFYRILTLEHPLQEHIADSLDPRFPVGLANARRRNQDRYEPIRGPGYPAVG